MNRKLTIPLLLLGTLLFILVALALLFLTQRRTQAATLECGVFFSPRLTAGGLWEIRVGCETYTEWITPASITFDPSISYPRAAGPDDEILTHLTGQILDDGTFVLDGLVGCLQAHPCPLTPGHPVAAEGQTQLNGYWRTYFPAVSR